MGQVYLGLGSNLGNRQSNLQEALDRLLQSGKLANLRASTVYETSPVGYTVQGNFLNAAVVANTKLAPHALLGLCQKIENDMGRKRSIKDGPRNIDIDILLYDDLVLDTWDLVLPHPKMHARRFVLAPLCDLNTNFCALLNAINDDGQKIEECKWFSFTY